MTSKAVVESMHTEIRVVVSAGSFGEKAEGVRGP
jgi:hypothetical protein